MGGGDRRHGRRTRPRRARWRPAWREWRRRISRRGQARRQREFEFGERFTRRFFCFFGGRDRGGRQPTHRFCRERIVRHRYRRAAEGGGGGSGGGGSASSGGGRSGSGGGRERRTKCQQRCGGLCLLSVDAAEFAVRRLFRCEQFVGQRCRCAAPAQLQGPVGAANSQPATDGQRSSFGSAQPIRLSLRLAKF